MDQELDEANALLEALQDEQRAAMADLVPAEESPEWLVALNKSLENPDDVELEDAAWAAGFEHRKSR